MVLSFRTIVELLFSFCLFLVLLDIFLNVFINRPLNEIVHKKYFCAQDFDIQSFYHLSDSSMNQIKQQAKKGQENIKDKQIVMVGLARNIGSSKLKRFRSRLRNLKTHIPLLEFCVMENDSKDDTRTFLKAWSHQDNWVHLIPCPNLHNELDDSCLLKLKDSYSEQGSVSTERMKKMAYLRNLCLDYVKNHFPLANYLMVMDLDLDGPFSIIGLLSVFHRLDWDMICANGVSAIVGSLGLVYCPYDPMPYLPCNEPFHNNFRNWYSTLRLKLLYMFSYFNWKPNQSPQRIRSGFNGLAIYNTKSIGNAVYTTEFGCEHIGFHQQIYSSLDQPRFFIHPNLCLLARKQGASLWEKLGSK